MVYRRMKSQLLTEKDGETQQRKRQTLGTSRKGGFLRNAERRYVSILDRASLCEPQDLRIHVMWHLRQEDAIQQDIPSKD